MEWLLASGSSQLLENAFAGPNMDVYGNQVSQGMAQRGITDQAMSQQAGANYQMDWQNKQLGWESMALNAAGKASDAWAKQAGIYTQELQNQMQAGVNQAQFTGMAAEIPLQTQQYIAGRPAANAGQYMQNLNMVNQLQAGQASAAEKYLNVNWPGVGEGRGSSYSVLAATFGPDVAKKYGNMAWYMSAADLAKLWGTTPTQGATSSTLGPANLVGEGGHMGAGGGWVYDPGSDPNQFHEHAFVPINQRITGSKKGRGPMYVPYFDNTIDIFGGEVYDPGGATYGSPNVDSTAGAIAADRGDSNSGVSTSVAMSIVGNYATKMAVHMGLLSPSVGLFVGLLSMFAQTPWGQDLLGWGGGWLGLGGWTPTADEAQAIQDATHTTKFGPPDNSNDSYGNESGSGFSGYGGTGDGAGD
jgi:hypothetical protein